MHHPQLSESIRNIVTVLLEQKKNRNWQRNLCWRQKLMDRRVVQDGGDGGSFVRLKVICEHGAFKNQLRTTSFQWVEMLFLRCSLSSSCFLNPSAASHAHCSLPKREAILGNFSRDLCHWGTGIWPSTKLAKFIAVLTGVVAAVTVSGRCLWVSVGCALVCDSSYRR